jgi:Ribonuclease G/E
MIKSDAAIAAEILRKMQAGVSKSVGAEVVVRVHPETAHHLEVDRRDAVERFQAMIGRKIVVQGVPSYHREQYDVTFK